MARGERASRGRLPRATTWPSWRPRSRRRRARARPSSAARRSRRWSSRTCRRRSSASGWSASTAGRIESDAARGRPERGCSARSRRSPSAGTRYTSDGALWLRTTSSATTRTACWSAPTGEHTYFASDIAYHQSKRERGLRAPDRRAGAPTTTATCCAMKAAYAALGGDPDELELLIMQFVHLVRGGERAQMSKRAGEFVTLEELRRRDRGGRGPLVPAGALARHHGRPRPRPGARAVAPRTPCTTSSTPTPASPRSLAQGRRRARCRRRCDASATPSQAPLHPAERALIEQLLAFPGELARGGASGARRTASRPTRSSSPRASRPSTATAACSAPSPSELESLRMALSEAAPHDDRALPGPARGERAGADVARRSRAARRRAAGASRVRLEARRVGGVERLCGAPPARWRPAARAACAASAAAAWRAAPRRTSTTAAGTR